MDNEKPFSNRRWTDPPGVNEDGTISVRATGTKHYQSKEEEQKDIETTKQIRKMFEERIKNSKK